MASTIQVDKIQDTGGNTILSSNSTGTFTYEAASGANFTNLPVPTSGIAASAIDSGTLAVAQGGTGAATFAAAGLANTPAMYVEASASTSVATATYTKVAFDQVVFNEGGTYDSTTNYRWTPGTAGKYVLCASIRWAGTTSADQWQCAVRINGQVPYDTNEGMYHSQAAADWGNNLTVGILELDADDYVEVWAYQTSGGTVGTGDHDPIVYFQGWRLII